MKENVVECVHICRGHARGIECVGVNIDRTQFATGAWDNLLKIWSTCEFIIFYFNFIING